MRKRTELLSIIKEAIGEVMNLNPNDIADTQSFYELGLDSYTCIMVLNTIELKYNLELNPVLFWDYPTLGAFADHLFEHYLNVNR